MQRIIKMVAIAMLATLILGAGTAEAAYRYGKYQYGGTEKGFFLFAEIGMANPRNSDTVVATYEQADVDSGINFMVPVVPPWSDDPSGRLGFGYSWGSGHKIVASFWGFETDQQTAAEGPVEGRLHFAIGPPIPTGVTGEYEGTYGSPGFFDITSEISAMTADVAWIKELELDDPFKLEWSVGLRYASFEETMEGSYNTGFNMGSIRYSAAKSNEGEMIGLRTGIRGTFRISASFSLSGGLGFSFLDGELTASSTLAEGADLFGEPSNFSGFADDSRSGTIYDTDIAVSWHDSSDRFRVYLGWEQSVWNDIVTDLVRNFPGTTAPLMDRDSVTFSGYKLGFYFRF
jgi:hypothetical protein